MLRTHSGQEKRSRNAKRSPKQLAARRRAASAAAKRQAKAKTAHENRLEWLKSWKRKHLAQVNTSGKSAADIRKSRNKVVSRYNRMRRAENAKFKRITANNYSPTRLSVRTKSDIFEHYNLHRLFSADMSIGGINDIINNQIAGSSPYAPDSFAGALDDRYTPTQPVLNLGVADISDLIEWVEVYDDSKNRTYTANITVPNSDQFYQIKARISG